MIHAVIKEKRKLAGYTQINLASKLGISQVSLCRWETGKTTPKLKHLLHLAQIIDLSLSDFSEAQPCAQPCPPPKK